MSFEKPSPKIDRYYCYLLLSITAVFITGCDEPPPPIPKTKLVTPATSSSAITKKIQSEKKQKDETKELVVRKLNPEKVQRGKIIYQKNCADCHGRDGESRPDWRKQGADGKYPPPPLNGSAHTWHHSTDTLMKVIREGSPPGIGGMPAWKDKLTDQEIDDVVVWITSIWPDEIYDIWYKEIELKRQKMRQHKLD